MQSFPAYQLENKPVSVMEVTKPTADFKKFMQYTAHRHNDTK